MSLFDMLGTILIGPLKLLFEVIFSIAYDSLENPGAAIVVLSLAMNILVLPLYRRADAIQIAARDTENKLKDVVAHIKKTFTGDERMMILQTYYRQNNYNPLSVLTGSISLLLEIPFFMAAYQFLSGVVQFQGVSFGPILDLSAPDGLLKFGSVAINLMPIIMTLVNVVSSSLYLKGFPLKTKIQLYGMALFFLVFLYNSPAALVFYWTLNNTFSLVKTLFYRIKNPKPILYSLLAIAGAGIFGTGLATEGAAKSTLMLAIGLAAQLPWAWPWLQEKIPSLKGSEQPATPNTKLFILGALFLTVLVGLLIPSTFVTASPQEYVDINYFYNPVWYVIHTFCLSAGTFLVWLGVFYWLANPKGKVLFSYAVWILSGIMLINYMFFGTNLGVVSPDLQYANGFWFAREEHLINLVTVVCLAVSLYILANRFSKGISLVLLTGAIALSCMSVINIVKIADAAEATKQQLSGTADERPSFSISQDGKNVVVIMIDRGIGPFVPYLLEENPTLKEQFDGFTYYSNTLSYGGYTNFAAPPLYGGYEYIPENMNLRDTERLVDKHNESLKVMPQLFAQENYTVTVLDPSYANYQWIPDVSIYDNMDGVSAYIAEGKFDDPNLVVKTISNRQRNFFFFSLMKTLPVSLQPSIYNAGNYYALPSLDTSSVNPAFMSAYHVMQNMSNMTNVTDGNGNTFMFLRSNVAHEPVVLQEPYFTPSSTVNNSAYYSEAGKTITDGSSAHLLSNAYTISHYHVNMAAFIQLGNWFDYLRESGVYDNTRIILVSDHGRNLGIFDQGATAAQDIEFYLPLLMVKDFNAEGFTTCEDFMTNADVPTLATAGLIDNPINPFTGNPINSAYKAENTEHHVILSDIWSVWDNNGYQFLPSAWATVKGTVVGNKENWVFHTGTTTLPPELYN